MEPSDHLHEQHNSVFVKGEPPEESEVPLFNFETVTKEELILEDDQADVGDGVPNGHPADVPVDEDRYKHFQCCECHKRYKRKKGANECEKKHEIIRKGLFECKICSKRFANKHHLAGHEEAHKRGTIKMLACNNCSMRFSSTALLENHKETHCREWAKISKLKKPVDNRPYKCTECSRKFDSLILVEKCFKRHEARQFGYFKCSYCGMHLGTKTYLNRHEAQHRKLQATGNNKSDILYRCHSCHEHFKNRGLLMRHVCKERYPEKVLDSENVLGEPVPEEDSKQFYIIEETPESAVAKEELQMAEGGGEVFLKQSQFIKAEPDFEFIIPHTVVTGEHPTDMKLEVKEEPIVPE